jgi:hypothetical protein
MASTPVIGAHYMFGGVALAVIGIWLAKYLLVPSSAKAHAAPQAALVPALD